MRSARFLLVLGLVASLATSAAAASAVTGVRTLSAATDGSTLGAEFDRSTAIVVFRSDPLATYDGRIRGYEKTRADHGKLNPKSAAAKKYLGYLKDRHAAYERWLAKYAPTARVVANYYTVANAVAVELRGNALGKITSNPEVAFAEYTTLYRPTMSQSAAIINAMGAWTAAGGRANAGAGVKVAVIDSGIDYRHPFFNPAGFSYPAGFPKCDATNSATGTPDASCKYVSPKVIVARAYSNILAKNGWDAMPLPDDGDHGSHVAGTIGGVITSGITVHGAAISGSASGVAPRAWLGNYNVFPGESQGARSEDILEAVEDAVLDGMDVMNLSLGGGYRGNNDILAKGLDNAVAAGVVVVASAGNEGPGSFTIGSPGRARDIITVGASSNSHFVGQALTYTNGGSRTIGAAVGDYAELSAGVTYQLVDTNSTACTSAALASFTLTGKLAIVNRGSCTFAEKVSSAKARGAIAVIVVNNIAGDPTALGGSEGYDDDIPAVMVSLSERAANRLTGAASVAVGVSLAEQTNTGNQDILAGFSSMGPTFVDEAIKPDLTSVGTNVLSSVVCGNAGATCTTPEWEFFGGTSMAAPHIAGSAAALLALHPTWTPADVKSALVNTADLVVKNARTAGTIVGPMAQGAGREDLTAAHGSLVTFVPASASFGRVDASRVISRPYTITLHNRSASAVTLAATATRFTPSSDATLRAYGAGSTSTGDARITYPSVVSVPANGSTSFTIVLKGGQALGSVVQGWITFSGGGRSYRVAYWAHVSP